jgi:hypothetical protein
MTVPISIFGKQCHALIDSGATTFLVRDSLLPSDVMLTAVQQQVVGLGGVTNVSGSVTTAICIRGL